MAADTDIFPPRYRGPQRIARGGMGEIFRATDSTLGRAVAIKILAQHYARDDEVRARFTREALAAARLSGQENTVTIYDVGEHDGRPFIVMEYLGGGSLEDVLREEGAQPPQRAFAWLEQAAAALDAAHREGVVHRDVKPANLMLDRAGNVHVADFGIASAAGLDSLTMTGTVLGTAGYLSPEQATGDRATPASDRYALALVAYELLTGRRPFEADSTTAEAVAHVNAPVPSVADAGSLPAELDPVFRKALAKEPADRFDSCAEFVAALRAAMAEAAGSTRALTAVPVAAPPRPARSGAWPLLAILLVAGIAAGAVGAYYLTRDGGESNRAAPPARVRTVTSTATVTQQTTTASAPAPAADGHALNDAGYSKQQAGDYAGAVPLLQQAVVKLSGAGPRDPYEAYANYNLGYSLLKLGRCSDAIPYLEKADSLEPWRHEPRKALKQAERCA
jgi:eukaryotic-like serine/threonine-protein kinase